MLKIITAGKTIATLTDTNDGWMDAVHQARTLSLQNRDVSVYIIDDHDNRSIFRNGYSL